MKIDTIDTQMPLGCVKSITSNGGKKLLYVELLLSSSTKVKFLYDEPTDSVQFLIEDNNLNIPEYTCKFDKDTLRDLIVGMKNMYGQLGNE